VAQQNTLKQVLTRIDKAVRELAAANGWQSGDYRLYVRINEGTLVTSTHLWLEARSFPGGTDFEKWERIFDFLDRKLKDVPELRGTLHLVIRTFDEDPSEGTRFIRDTFTPIEELIAPAPAA
jgi:hypothetical protein